MPSAKEKAEEIRGTVGKGVRTTLQDIGRDIENTVIGCQQTNLPSAMAADLLDIIPLIGDLTNAARVVDAAAKGEERVPKRTLMLQIGDLIGGVLPGIGTVIDFLTPTCTLEYLRRR